MSEQTAMTMPITPLQPKEEPVDAVGAASTPSDRQALATVRDLQKSFHGRSVLEGVDFEVCAREISVIIGKSGSGKSTLLRVLAGLTDAESGTVTFGDDVVLEDGVRTKAWGKHSRTVGMVFQSYNLWPHMTVLENLILAPSLVLKEKRTESIARAERALDEVGMREHISSRSTQLSGGERQRVAIARALMMQPKLLLCDEITSALDPPVAAEVLDVLIRLKHEDGIAVALVTHDMAFAAKAADRLVFFHDGKVEVDSTPEDAFQHCRNPHLKKFVDAVRF